LIFVLLDYVLTARNRSDSTEKAPARVSPGLQAAYVEGFLVPEQLAYLPGTPGRGAGAPNLVRVGIDEFAAALAGRVEKNELPKPGQWIRQGSGPYAAPFGEKAEMVSPHRG